MKNILMEFEKIKINDWPLIENTLYDGQKIINIFNMSAGFKIYK